jgi:preprotein translocase subunit YajC
MWSTLAYAQAAASPKPGLIENLFPFIFIFVIFYFFMIRPQQKRQGQHQEFLKNIKRGDAVLTTGGLLGTIEGVTDAFVTLEVSDGVRVRILKTAIASPAQEGKS